MREEIMRFRESVINKIQEELQHWWRPALSDEYMPWYFNPHGPKHARNVAKNSKILYNKLAGDISEEQKLIEESILEIAAWGHDISMANPDSRLLSIWNKDFNEFRKKHGQYSSQKIERIIDEYLSFNRLKYGETLKYLISRIIKNHQGKPEKALDTYPLDINGREVPVRIWLLVGVLRLADLLDENEDRFKEPSAIDVVNKAVAWGLCCGPPLSEQIKFYLPPLLTKNPVNSINISQNTLNITLELYDFPKPVTFYPGTEFEIIFNRENLKSTIKETFSKEIKYNSDRDNLGLVNSIFQKYDLDVLVEFNIKQLDVPLNILNFLQSDKMSIAYHRARELFNTCKGDMVVFKIGNTYYQMSIVKSNQITRTSPVITQNSNEDVLEFFDRLFERGLPKNVPPEVLEAYHVWNKLKYLEKQINGKERGLEELLEAYGATSDPITRVRINEDITLTKETLKELYSKRKKFREKLQELKKELQMKLRE